MPLVIPGHLIQRCCQAVAGGIRKRHFPLQAGIVLFPPSILQNRRTEGRHGRDIHQLSAVCRTLLIQTLPGGVKNNGCIPGITRQLDITRTIPDGAVEQGKTILSGGAVSGFTAAANQSQRPCLPFRIFKVTVLVNLFNR
ncbi:hypothetical protein D3C75_594870 [compost metagenome]